MEDGRTLPRPPRRVPAAAGTLTQVQAARPRTPEPPPRRPWIFGRILAGFVVLLVIGAAGASVGWFVRAHTLRIDTAQTLRQAGPAVVRVLATTCNGSGEASGVLTDNGRILTATSAVREPKSIVVVTADGVIRRANLLGTSSDGVAVLQPVGARIDAAEVPVPTGRPDANAERALIGYTSAGDQTIQPIGSAADPRPLSAVMNAAKLGGPVLDRSGQLVGVVVGDTVADSTIVPFDRLRGYAATSANITPEPGGACALSRGPQTPVTPELQVAGTELATEAQKLLGNYLTLQNKHDFVAVRQFYSDRLAKALTVERDRNSHATSYFFGAKLTEVNQDAAGAVYARMTYDILFSPVAEGASGQTCNRLDVRYRLVREDGALVIDVAQAMSPALACDAD